MPVLVLSEAELRQCVRLDLELVDAVSNALAALASGSPVVPPSLQIALPDVNGEVDVRAGYAAETGRLEALHLDHGWLTNLAAAAAGAVAARSLAPAEASVAGVLGAGTQARLQIEALTLVRPIERVLVWARAAAKAEAFADQMADRLGLDVLPVASVERLVLEAEVVVTATAARAPLVVADWLHPGLHVTAIGADAPDKNELHPAVLARADRVVCDRRDQCARRGELHHALAAYPGLEVIELGEITAGRRPGRQGEGEITVCDLTGTGALDSAVALLAYRKACAAGLGSMIAD